MKYEEDSILLFNLLDLLLQQVENPLGIDMIKISLIKEIFEEWKEENGDKYKDIVSSPTLNKKIDQLEYSLSHCYDNFDPSFLFLGNEDDENIEH